MNTKTLNTPNIRFIIILVMIIGITNSCKKDSNTSKTIDRTAYFGSWQASEDWSGGGSSGHITYSVSITASATDQNSIDLYGFNRTADTYHVNAIVNGSSFTIPTQDNGGINYDGSGTLSSDGKTISIMYTYGTGTFTGTWTKQ